MASVSGFIYHLLRHFPFPRTMPDGFIRDVTGDVSLVIPICRLSDIGADPFAEKCAT